MKIKTIAITLAIILVIAVAIAAIVFFPFYHSFTRQEKVLLDQELIVLRGGGGNSGVLVTDSAVVVIDTKMGGDSEKLYKLAKEKAGHKKIIVINTHYHGDHVKGNHFYKGSAIYIGNYDPSFLAANVDKENMPNHSVRDSLVLNLGDESVLMFNVGQAHTMHDMVVYLENRKVLFTGDLIFNKINPVLMKKSGADVDKWIGALDLIQKKWEIKTIVPGHGSIGGKELPGSMKQYFLDMQQAVADPTKEKALKEKYDDWIVMPMMASPGFTMDYIRKGK